MNQDVVPTIHPTWQNHIHLISGLHGTKWNPTKQLHPFLWHNSTPTQQDLMAECVPKTARCIHLMLNAWCLYPKYTKAFDLLDLLILNLTDFERVILKMHQKSSLFIWVQHVQALADKLELCAVMWRQLVKQMIFQQRSQKLQQQGSVIQMA